MTTWPGFGDGTFHDPDRYVREGRQKDDVKPVISPGNRYIDTFDGPPLKMSSVDFAKYKKLYDALGEPHERPKMEVFDFQPEPLCLHCGLPRCKAPCPNHYRPVVSPEVSEAMKIMYPEDDDA